MPITLSLCDPTKSQTFSAEAVNIFASTGAISILSGHIDFMGRIDPGLVIVTTAKGRAALYCSYGVFQVNSTKASTELKILCDEFEESSNVDVSMCEEILAEDTSSPDRIMRANLMLDAARWDETQQPFAKPYRK